MAASLNMLNAQAPSNFPEHPPRPVKIQVDVVNYLNFGTFSYYSSGGTVKISTSGFQSKTGDVVLFTTGSAGIITVSGNKGTVISFMIPSSSITFGASSMSMDYFTTDPASVVLPDVPGLSTQLVTIGATLTVSPGNTPGTYNGTFKITLIQE